MYIIVIGAGRVGYYLTRELIQEGHEVLLVEKTTSICETINEEMGSVCFHGDGCEASTLAEIGTGRADMFVSVTGDDEDNMVACQIAKYRFNVPRTIARIRNPRNEALFKKLGIDVTVSTTALIMEAIEKEVPTHPLVHLLTDRGLDIVQLRVMPQSKSAGKPLRDLELPEGVKLALIIPRDDKPYVPNQESVLHNGDQVIALTAPELEQDLRTRLTGG